MIVTPLYLVVGKTCSGKDTFVDNMMVRFGLTKVRSYTTRSRRTKIENTHTFVKKKEFDKLRKNFVAVTYYDDHEYGATLEQVSNADFYIVDLVGALKVIQSPAQIIQQRQINLIYIYENLLTRIERMVHRSPITEREVGQRVLLDAQNFSEGRVRALMNQRKLRKVYSYSSEIAKDIDNSAAGTFEEYMIPFEGIDHWTKGGTN